jgi:methylaspartate ammonia-lyase
VNLDLIRESIRKRYCLDERGHAVAILANDFPSEFNDILDTLDAFTLKKSDILTPGGGRSPIPKAIDGFLQTRG